MLTEKLIHVQTLAEELMRIHGLIPGWSFAFDRAKRRLGCCHYPKKLITLSGFYSQNNPMEAIRNTILHEIAHALTPKQGHNRVWRAKALEIGCNGQRCGNVSIKPKPKYIAKCTTCSHEHHM